jgi:hypothetical protein
MNRYELSDKRKEYYKSKEYKEQLKRYRDKEKYKQYQKEFHQTDICKQYNKEFLRAYRQTERFKLWNKKWNQTPQGIANMIRQHLKRRAIKNNIIEVYTEIEWKKKLEATNGICPCCNKYVGLNNLHRDHIYSISKASEDFKRTGIKRIYSINDMQPLCKKCNSTKYNKEINFNDIKTNTLEVVQIQRQ